MKDSVYSGHEMFKYVGAIIGGSLLARYKTRRESQRLKARKELRHDMEEAGVFDSLRKLKTVGTEWDGIMEGHEMSNMKTTLCGLSEGIK